MGHINREGILKGFLDKVREAKRLQMKEVKMPIRELDDIAYIIYQLMSEEVSRVLNGLEKPEETPQVVEKPISRKILNQVHIVKKEEVPIVEEKKEEIIEVEPKKEDNNIQNNEEENIEENSNTLYGGSW